jgi:sugar phosphate isomerase/epimerase
MKRSRFLKSLLIGSAVTGCNFVSGAAGVTINERSLMPAGLKTSLNFYSFNDALRNGSVSLEKLLEFCAKQEFDGVDITGYYFKNYPAVPPAAEVRNIKRKAHALGLGISGTGVRNDFTHSGKSVRLRDLETVKSWIPVAALLGAPVLRIFSGLAYPAKADRKKYTDELISLTAKCVEWGKEHGVIIAMQNHHDFLRNSDEVIEIIQAINSEWFGLVLDIGSYRGTDPFSDITKTAGYAVNWQIKENMYVNGTEQKTDLKKIFGIVKASGYKGYLPIETLGAGDPFEKVPKFYKEVKAALAG